MKTFSLKPTDVKRQWYVLDASEAPLGRLATAAARLLLAKDKVNTSPHVDNGDYVIVINAGQMVTTGSKEQKKTYWRHSGFPGGIKKRKLGDVKATNPQQAITHAIRGMLPDNKLRDGRLARLKIYNDSEHNHTAQSPKVLSLKKENK
jgi:large subunit ribosomal protein L13